MTPLPKKKISKARQGKRRASINLKLTNLAKCPNCGQKLVPHRACTNCGMYASRMISVPKTKTKVKRVTSE